MPNLFLRMLEHLRHYEELMLYGNILKVTEEEQKEVIQYLSKEYEREAVAHPYTVPDFDPKAALWGAKTVYLSAQLMLYRENKEADLENLLPSYEVPITAAAMLSADLSLRFVVPVVEHLKIIDPEDSLIKLLESHLVCWHYSAVGYFLSTEDLQFDSILSSQCLYQLYIDRIIEHKSLSLAKHPMFCHGISASLGMYGPELWSDFKFETSIVNATN